MVFPDLSAPEIYSQKCNLQDRVPLASIADRFLAFILDFLICSPVVSLVTAGLLKQSKTFFLLNSSSQEGVIAIGLMVVLIVFFTVLLQTAFLYFWQATPGQFFLQMRVVSYPHSKDHLSLNQCFLRSLMFCSGFVFLALPFLEIASHPLRRAFHERASDTLVVTLKKVYDEGPHPLESRFISSWMRMSFLFLLLLGVLGFFKTYHSLQIGSYKENSAQGSLVCKELKDTKLSGESRLDAAISLYLLNGLSIECLNKEADSILWGGTTESKDMAYLAKFIISDGDEQEEYYQHLCQEASSSICALATYMHEKESQEKDIKIPNQLLTAKLLLSDEKYSSHDYAGSLQIIDELQKVPELKEALEKRYVRTVWSLTQETALKSLKKGGRAPASAEDQWLDRFKERYEVP